MTESVRKDTASGAGAAARATDSHVGRAAEATRPAAFDRESLRAYARTLEVDLVGFASVADLEAELPPEARPSTLAYGMKTFVVMAKRTLRGVTWARHLPSKQLAGGRNLRVLDLATDTLVRALERDGHPSLPVVSAAIDFDRRGPLDLTPAGQGSPLLRHAAVAGGLGTWGLNLMVLTPELGPRVLLGGVMTTLELEPDRRIETELCLGLEQCGRCAAVCPEDAIQRRAPVGAGPAAGRGLDCVACARSSQPFGFHKFTQHMGHIMLGGDAKEMWSRMRNRTTGEMWSEMAMMKEAALTGCSECVQVCPVGADYERIAATPHRRSDLPDPLPRTIENGMVEVPNLGPQVRRKTTWEKREKDVTLTQDLKQMALELGADSVGVASVEAYSARVPNGQKPAFLAEGMNSIIVMTKHLLTGCLAIEDVATQSTNSHLALDLVDEVAYRTAEWLEDRGHAALPVSPEYADMDVVWTGGGLLDLKWTAEFAGLGHVGLNLNFLSPDYGSRVYLVALLTDAVLEPDAPLDHDLCPGLECGRCGVLCPPKAIPLEAPKGQSVNDYRNLDQSGCSQAAMRISIRSLYSVLRKLMSGGEPPEAMQVLDNRYWYDYYLATNSKRGAFAACFECLYVCPVGGKDVKKIMRIPYRRMDLPPGSVKHDRSGETHKVGYLGPPKDRDPEYIRDREFDHLVKLSGHAG